MGFLWKFIIDFKWHEYTRKINEVNEVNEANELNEVNEVN